mgnify:FL=1
MHFSIFLFSLLFSLSNHASDTFWSDVLDQNFKKSNNKSVIIVGVLTHIKRKYNARDTWYLLDLKDENSDRFVTVTLFTTKRLKSVNLFECNNGDKFRISGNFNYITSGNQIGTVLINSKDKKLKCYKPKTKDIR